MAARRLDAEVAVIGGGPAGAAAAIGCAQQGLRVILCERDLFTRERPGEALHPGIEQLFGQLGIAERLAAVVGARHAGVWVAWGGAPRFEPFGEDGAGAWQGFQVDRKAFDALLLDRARELGVDVRQPCAVRDPILSRGKLAGLETSGGPLRCRMVIDGSGAARFLARKLRLAATAHSPKLAVRYGYATGACATRDAAPALTGDTHGWTWTARVGGGLYQWIRLQLDGQLHKDWRPEEFRSLAPRGPSRGADVTWRLCEQAAGEGWFIAGDAAAMLDPCSSHGVLKAIMSGMTTGYLAAAVLKARAPHIEAAVAYQEWIGERFDADVAQLSAYYERLGYRGFGTTRA